MTTPILPCRLLVGISCEAQSRGIGIARADRHAFLQAAWIAQRTGGAVRAFHVTDFFDERIVDGGEAVAQRVHDSLDGQLEALCAAATANRVQTSHGFARGKPWLEMLREAHRWEADLIVISPRRTAISVGSRIVHGSTARRLIRKANEPVLVVVPGPGVGISNVLACVDGSPVSTEVMAVARGMAELAAARRVVLRCLDYPDDIALRRLPHADETVRAYHARVRETARAGLSALAEAHGPGWEVELSDGYVADVVPHRVERDDVDLVVLASGSHGALAGALLGTTAERILDAAPVSTLVVRPSDWRSPIQL